MSYNTQKTSRTYKTPLTKGNYDNIWVAVDSLNKFMHNYCMDSAKTVYKNSVQLRCDQCEFNSDKGCLLKIFKDNHLPEFDQEHDFGVKINAVSEESNENNDISNTESTQNKVDETANVINDIYGVDLKE